MNISDYNLFASSEPRFYESLFKNISDGITGGLKSLLSAREGSVFFIPIDSQMRIAHEYGQYVIESSGFVIALNASEPPSYDVWSELAIAVFHSKAPSSAIRNLVSAQTFKV
jgi:hypothetical protein